MIRPLIFLLTYCFCLANSCQSQKGIFSQINRYTYQINSIKSSENFEDLKPLGLAIGEARVVLLGEQDHGDASTFEAKNRIIQFLHQKLDFEVLIFESDFFSLNQNIELSKENKGADSLILNNVFRVWTKCTQFEDLISYLNKSQKSDKPMLVSGMDIQLYGKYSQDNFKNEFLFFLQTINSVLVADSVSKKETKLFVDSLLLHSKNQTFITDTPLLKRMTSSFLNIVNNLTAGSYKNNYQLQVVKSLTAQCESMLSRSRSNLFASGQIRDNQMADNLLWLIKNKFLGKKIVVWAANSHIFKRIIPAGANVEDGVLSMGYHLENLDSSISKFYLGFTSMRGRTKRFGGQEYKIFSPEPNSLEWTIKKMGFPFAFVNFKAARRTISEIDRSFYMSGLGHKQIKLNWLDGYDGVFFIEEMEPCNFRY